MRLPSTVTILPGTPISPPKMLLLVSNRPSEMLLLVSIRPSRLVTFGLESLTRMAFVGRGLPSGFVCCDHGQSCSVDFHSCLAMSGSTFFMPRPLLFVSTSRIGRLCVIMHYVGIRRSSPRFFQMKANVVFDMFSPLRVVSVGESSRKQSEHCWFVCSFC